MLGVHGDYGVGMIQGASAVKCNEVVCSKGWDVRGEGHLLSRVVLRAGEPTGVGGLHLVYGS